MRLLASALALTVLATGTTVSAQEAKVDPVRAMRSKLTNLEAAVGRLASEYANPVASLSGHPIQRRLIDARVFYELGNYESAAVLLLDVVDKQAFRSNPEYHATAMLLGQALFKLDNREGARRYFTVAMGSTDSAIVDEAQYYLIDMALEADNPKQLREAVTRIGSAASSDRTRYALGKAHIRLGEPARALSALNGITSTSESYILSRYYVGVALTALKRYDEALAEFGKLASLQGKEGDERKARDLSRLAVGRLLMEQGKIDDAVHAYQQIDRRSEYYQEAIYEMAWAYVRREEFDKALRMVDILLLLVEGEQLSVEAHVLRGRLSIKLDDYDNAVESYEQILRKFAPIRNELERFTRDPANIDRYFAWLLERHDAAAGLQAPLTKRTQAWVASTESMSRVVAVFNTLSEEAGEIEATKELARDLERVVTSANRVERFPRLKEGWTRALALQNRLLTLSSAMLDLQYDLAKGTQAAAQVDLDTMVTWRHKLEDKFRKMPRTYEQYTSRKAKVDSRYLDLQRRGFLVETTLKELKKRLLGIENYVNDKQFADSGEKLTSARETEIREAIADEKRRLTELFDELMAVKKSIEIESQKIGTGDVVTQGEASLRASLIAAHKRESLAYDRVAQSLGGETARVAPEFTGLRQKIWSLIEQLEGTVARIDERVTAKTEEVAQVIRREQRRLDAYDNEMASHESSSKQIARAMGEELFARAQQRMQDVVLEADVGLIDVAWQRKRHKTDEIRELNQERAEKLRRLEKESERLLREAGVADEEGK